MRAALGYDAFPAHLRYCSLVGFHCHVSLKIGCAFLTFYLFFPFILNHTTTTTWFGIIHLAPLEKLKELETKTGYSKVYFFLAIAAVLSGLLTLLGGAKLIVDLVGFVYPAYQSFKSMDANNGEDTQWLTYWVVFASLSIVEGMAGFIIRLIPFYYMTKTGFILWLYHPQTMGAQSIYAGVIRPVMLPYLETGPSKKTE